MKKKDKSKSNSSSKSFREIVKSVLSSFVSNWLTFAFAILCAFMAWVLLSL